MHLLEQYMIEERSTIMAQNIVVRTIGRRDGIPDNVIREMDKTIELSSSNTGTRLCLAINYGGRGEIVDAVRAISTQVRGGQLDPELIDEATVSSHLYTAGMPDPDLMIRTASEMRISNFLLWQISYAELWVTEKVVWPRVRRTRSTSSHPRFRRARSAIRWLERIGDEACCDGGYFRRRF